MRLCYNLVRGLLLQKMGAHLSSPKTEKVSTSGGDFRLDSTVFGATSMQGWRISMEDAHLTIPSYNNTGDRVMTPGTGDESISVGSIYGVFDGHGGNCVSRWVSENFSNVFSKEFRDVRRRYLEGSLVPKHESDSVESKLVAEALQNSFLRLDQHLATPEVDSQLHLISNRKNDEIDSTNLFKVLLPEKLNNRQHAIDIIQQLTSFDNSFTPATDTTQVEEELNKYDSIPYYKDDQVDEATINSELGIDTDEPMESDGSVGGTTTQLTTTHTDTSHTSQTSNTSNTTTQTESDTAAFGTYGTAVTTVVNTLLTQKEREDLYAMGCGATSVVVVVLEDPVPCVVVANAGDSRCVLSRNKLAVPLSVDHKPTDELELSRIRRAGGNVINGRVDGNLNLSRSLGDLSFKMDQNLDQREQKIISFPDIQIVKLTRDDEFLVLACDGIWDCKSNQQVVDFIHTKLTQYADKLQDKHSHGVGVGDKHGHGVGVGDKHGHGVGMGMGMGMDRRKEVLERICEELCDLCLSSNPSESEGIGCDNMTVIIVLFNQQLYNKIH
ncbi:Protein phosphatase 2C family protein [Theileria parva strain Muguga]|uniref:Protein phosphatase 2C family protein n=1 Tax=Theileria parva strain Muguga TaxID=333668 RepID=UPI001C623FB4|nr:Protein phosphatase 2C family protein [Theileria parva strain Muguga]EAN33146.2 Protein phosphatase 2C family protein [Theileria parva strain Muguga]